jgi:hypothetical protein
LPRAGLKTGSSSGDGRAPGVSKTTSPRRTQPRGMPVVMLKTSGPRSTAPRAKRTRVVDSRVDPRDKARVEAAEAEAEVLSAEVALLQELLIKSKAARAERTSKQRARRRARMGVVELEPRLTLRRQPSELIARPWVERKTSREIQGPGRRLDEPPPAVLSRRCAAEATTCRIATTQRAYRRRRSPPGRTCARRGQRWSG